MTVNEFMEHLISGATEIWNPTSDQRIAGDGSKPVRKIATSFKATAEVIRKAADARDDLLIVHEPVFYGREQRPTDPDPVEAAKWALIDQSGLVIWRFHDHAHLYEPDFIHDGFIRALGLEIRRRYPVESLGIRRYELASPIRVDAFAKRIGDALGLSHVRIVGRTDLEVNTVCLGLGSVGVDHIKVLTRSDTELFITGEIDEIHGCEYVRDAAYFGRPAALMLLGHCGAEYAGMRLLADWIGERYPELQAEYIHCGEVYR